MTYSYERSLGMTFECVIEVSRTQCGRQGRFNFFSEHKNVSLSARRITLSHLCLMADDTATTIEIRTQFTWRFDGVGWSWTPIFAIAFQHLPLCR